MDEFPLELSRFCVRPLTASDATERYLSWFSKPGAEHIVSSTTTRGLNDLREYIASREGRREVLFLGIFERENGNHLGNVKYEPVDSERGFAVMGIFIGEPKWRGVGVAGEVLPATASWLARKRGIREIVLGVENDNRAAIRAYEKVGFVRRVTPLLSPATGCHTMVWTLPT